jgi:hypothetical protein
VAQITIAITKRAAFRDATQEWSNVYTYGSFTLHPDEAAANTLIDELVANEKTFHATNISFVYGRCWRSGGTKEQNTMIAQKALTGTGAMTPLTAMDLERAFLIQWPAGQDSRGRPVKLRKWYHTNSNLGGVSITNAILANTTGFSAANRDAIEAVVDVVTRIDSNTRGLIADSGRERSGDGNPVAHRYLEHHQLGDQWRG